MVTKLFALTLIGLASATALAFPLPRAGRALLKNDPHFTGAYNFVGIVGLSNCSGSLIRFESSQDNDKSMILTNGHCFEGGFADPNTYRAHEHSSRRFTLLDAGGNALAYVNAQEMMYTTMTGTDITIYRLTQTYKEIATLYNTLPYTLSSQHPAVAQMIDVISGYWERGYTCAIEAFPHELHEGDWIFTDSVRYSRPGCDVIGGTSGSPVILQGSRTVIAINNTTNEDGDKCSVNNPCEVDTSGNITYVQGYGYAQETYQIYTCVNANRDIDLTMQGCMLYH
jgi:hypothetical protein